MENLVDIYKKASLVMKPAAMKEGKLYSQQPHSGDGDFTFSRANGTQTRINKHGLIETVADNTPRLSYELDSNGNVSECPHLLLEPTRTNNILQSNDPSVSNWTDPLGRWELLNETTLSPDGSDVRVIELTEDGGSLIRLTGFSISSGTYTLSFYIKDIDGNLSGGNVDVGDEGSGAPSPSFGDVGSGWVRATRTITTTATRSHIDLQPTFSGTTNKVAIWGVQLEAGSNATSLIPTSGSSAQRMLDNCTKVSFNNMPTDYPLTAFWQGKIDNYDATGFTSQVPFSLAATGTFNCYFGLNFYSTSQLTLRRRNDSDNNHSVSFTSDKDTTYKIAVCFISANSVKIYINGTEILNSTSLTSVPYIGPNTPDSVLLGQLRNSSDTGKKNSCDQFMLFNEELTNSELTELTS